MIWRGVIAIILPWWGRGGGATAACRPFRAAEVVDLRRADGLGSRSLDQDASQRGDRVDRVQGFRYVPASAFGWVVPASGSNGSHP
jgi:hypothetical protein